MGTALKLWLLIDVPYLSTLVCLIAEQGLIREQDGIFLRIAKGVGPNKRAGYSEHGIFSNLSLQKKRINFGFSLLRMLILT